MTLRFLAVMLLVVGLADTHADLRAADSTFPKESWERIDDPAASGWSAAGLEEFRTRLARTETLALVAIHEGRVLVEYGDVRKPNDVNSVRKSLLSALFGRYVTEKKIRLDATLAELGIDDIGGLSASEKQATVRDLLKARSGIYHPASNSGDDSAKAPPRGTQAHGTYFLYNNWDFNALGTIFEKETGKNIYDAFDQDIAKPLGMEDFQRSMQKKTGDLQRSMHPAYKIHISTRDLARVGYLMLREGQWAGRQVVPAAWVKESTGLITPVVQMNPENKRRGPLGYGYLWWIWDQPWSKGAYEGAFTATGLRGQELTVLPKLDLVVAHETAGGARHPMTHAQFRELLDVLVKARGATQ